MPPDLNSIRESWEAAHTARSLALQHERELRRLLARARADGVSVIELAAALGVSRQRVYQLLR